MNMEIPLVTVSWKRHSNELATVCKNLLADKFLVDCTLAAEGQRLTAHRLILSASSPYFRMLFSEGGEKHPIVFLKDVSFEMLKAVVDFVYHGETRIPKIHFEVFLALAQSLQIVGICNSFKSDRTENVSCGTEYYQNNTEIQETGASPEDSSQNCCQQTQHHSGSNIYAIQSLSSAVDEECLDSGDQVQGAREFLPLCKPLFPLRSEELCVDSEIPVKPEPSYFEFSEPKHERVDDFEMEEKTHGNFLNEMGEGIPPAFNEQVLSQYTSSKTDTAQLPSSAEHGECLDSGDQVERASTTLHLLEQPIPLESEELCLDSEIIMKHEPLHFEVSESKHEHVDDIEMDGKASGKLRNKMNEGTSPTCSEEDLNQYTSYKEPCPGSMGSASVMLPQQQQQVMLDATSGVDCAAETESLLPVMVVVKSKQRDNVKKDDPMRSMLQNNENERDQDINLCGGRVINQCSSAAEILVAEPVTPPSRRKWSSKQVRPDEQPHRSIANPTCGSILAQRKKTPADHRPFSCDLCGDTFRWPGTLRYHKSKHTGERPFQCHECGASFMQSSDLKKHQRTHTGERPFHCEVCGVSFTQSGNLKTHQLTHTGERPFSCNVCGASFTTSSHLSTHKRTHTGERPFHCHVCGASFTQSSDLKKHQRTHTGERPFHCDVCGVSFTLSGHLKTHQLTHTGERPFSCDVCGAFFTSSSNLRTHMRTHTGERPFHCAVCGASFSQIGNLKTHMRRHTGERPFQCKVCGKSFTRMNTLRQHKLRHSMSVTSPATSALPSCSLAT